MFLRDFNIPYSTLSNPLHEFGKMLAILGVDNVEYGNILIFLIKILYNLFNLYLFLLIWMKVIIGIIFNL